MDKNYGKEDKELKKIRDRLLKINKKVNDYLKPSDNPSKITETKDNDVPISGDVSLKEIHERLHAINDYVRKRLKMQPAAHEEVSPVSPPPISPAIEKEISAEKEVIEEKEPAPKKEVVEEKEVVKEKKPAAGKKAAERLGIGLDAGTSYIVAVREVSEENNFVRNIKSERNIFLSVVSDKITKGVLDTTSIKYLTLKNMLYIYGNPALGLSNIFDKEIQRPMNKGILNPSEAESAPVMKMLIEDVIWSPRKEGEVCSFSVPSPSIDRDEDTIYHKEVFEDILRGFGFEPLAIDEGYAVVLSELHYRDFTGIGISCGGGLVNICAAFRGIPAVSFSISRGGDWIDNSAASVLGIPSGRVTAIKEEGMNLKHPINREQEAIAIYYRNFIHYFLENMAGVFGQRHESPKFEKPVDIIFAGGSTMVGEFLDVVKEELKSIDLGFPVDNVKKADNPFTTVVRGCLINAVNAERHR